MTTDSANSERERLDLERFKGHTPGPWAVETLDNECGQGKFHSHCVMDAQGRSLFDTLNADYRITTIQIEYDEDGATQWDEQGRLNLELAAAAPDLLAELTSLRSSLIRKDEEIEGLRAIIKLNHDRQCNTDWDFYEDSEMRSLNEQVLAAQAEGRQE